jgi:hypothetical protein
MSVYLIFPNGAEEGMTINLMFDDMYLLKIHQDKVGNMDDYQLIT